MLVPVYYTTTPPYLLEPSTKECDSGPSRDIACAFLETLPHIEFALCLSSRLLSLVVEWRRRLEVGVTFACGFHVCVVMLLSESNYYFITLTT